MILKPYQLSDTKSKNSSFFLFYGQNEGHKNEAIQKILDMGFAKNIFRYEEDEILNNYNNFIKELSNKSFFEEKKIIIISRASEKIYSLIIDVVDKNIEDVKIIINSKPLDKKSKLRSNFEKEKNLVCVAFYDDNNATLANFANKFFLKIKFQFQGKSSTI